MREGIDCSDLRKQTGAKKAAPEWRIASLLADRSCIMASAFCDMVADEDQATMLSNYHQVWTSAFVGSKGLLYVEKDTRDVYMGLAHFDVGSLLAGPLPFDPLPDGSKLYHFNFRLS